MSINDIMKFKSQICTTVEQSERLLALGLKKETADMVHYFSQSLVECWTIVPLDNGEVAENNDLEIPAWSLSRLIEICRGPYLKDIPTSTNDNESVDLYEWLIEFISYAVQQLGCGIDEDYVEDFK